MLYLCFRFSIYFQINTKYFKNVSIIYNSIPDSFKYENYNANSKKILAAGRLTDGKGFDAVFDTVGGENLPKSFEATRPLGQVMAISTWGTYDLSILNAKGLNLRVIFCMYPLVSGVGRAHYGEILSQVAQLVEEEKIHPILDPENFTFLDAARAHEHLESGKAIGKIVLTNE